MNKIFTSESIRLIDRLTIETEPVSSIDLMERASVAFVDEFCRIITERVPVLVISGPGNNGGDGLAVARLLVNRGFTVTAWLISNAKLSSDCQLNKLRITDGGCCPLVESSEIPHALSLLDKDTVIVDAIFGSGLTRPPEGVFEKLISEINSSGLRVVSVDIPSGMFCEGNTDRTETLVVKAGHTISFQFHKIAFFMPENLEYTGMVHVVDIGLSQQAVHSTDTDYFFTDIYSVSGVYRRRPPFSHKGTFGHALMIAGSAGMAGAALLASKACLRSGAGLVTLHSAASNRQITQSAIPELIFSADTSTDFVTDFPDLNMYQAIGVGCGLRVNTETAGMMEKLLRTIKTPCVIDADALNLIAANHSLLNLLGENCILTPHPKEFDRLFGKHTSTWQRIQTARAVAQKYRIVIVLKGSNTVVVATDGKCYFNTTGNSGLATGGTGDVLTGIVTGLLAQQYTAFQAAVLGVFLHGLSADLALQIESEESLTAGDVIQYLGRAFKKVIAHTL